MRLHGIQLRGLPGPAGEHQLDLDAGLSSLEVASLDDARRLARLFAALLCPGGDELGERVGFGSGDGRALLSFAARSDTYLLAVDGAREAVQLGHQDGRGRYRNAASGSRAVDGLLAELGRPAASDFLDLFTLGVFDAPVSALPAAAESAPAAAPEAGQQAEDPTPVQDPILARERATLLERIAELETADANDEVPSLGTLGDDPDVALAEARSRLAAAQSQLARAGEGGSERVDPTQICEGDLETRLEEYREALEVREQDRRAIQGERRELLGRRARLRREPARQSAATWLGLGLAASAAAATWFGYPLAGIFGVVGLIAVVSARSSVWKARRELGQVEAVLTALRLRERTSERRFESAVEPVHKALEALGLERPEELKQAVDRMVALEDQVRAAADRVAQAESVVASLEDDVASRERQAQQAAQRAAEKRQSQLARMQERLAELDALLGGTPVVAGAADDRAAAEPDTPGTATEATEAVTVAAAAPAPPADPVDPDELIQCAARIAQSTPGQVRDLLAATLPLYLRALSGGAYTHARRHANDGWMVQGPDSGTLRWTELDADKRRQVDVALQLALLERIGRDVGMPLIVGPDLAPLRTAHIARALGRLSAVVQVVRIGPPEAPWGEHAARSLPVA